MQIFSRAVLVPFAPANFKRIRSTFVVTQTKQAIENLAAVLGSAGIGLGDVVKTTVFLRKAQDYESMNEVYKTYFKDAPPARTTVQVIPPLKSIQIELEAVAYIP